MTSSSSDNTTSHSDATTHSNDDLTSNSATTSHLNDNSISDFNVPCHLNDHSYSTPSATSSSSDNTILHSSATTHINDHSMPTFPVTFHLNDDTMDDSIMTAQNNDTVPAIISSLPPTITPEQHHSDVTDSSKVHIHMTNNNASCRDINDDRVHIGKYLHVNSSTSTKHSVRKRQRLECTNGDHSYHCKKRYKLLRNKYAAKLSLSRANINVESVINDVSKVVDGDCLTFITHQIRMAQRQHTGRRYTDEIRLLAINLYNSGPKAYKYLAKIFALPSKTSLNKWLCNMKCTPGFNNETFTALAERFKFMTEREKVCSVLIDEINLKSHLQYDRQNDLITGYQDLGSFGGRSNAKAKSALVFMIRGLSTNWCQPLGYVYTASACKSHVIKALLLDCLDKCREAGAVPKVIISDQGTNFQQLVKSLGISVDKPYFEHKDKHYFYMYDPAHLIKSIRNNLFKYSFLIDGNKTATWDVIKQFYKMDSKQTIRLCPKLTDTHINLPAFSKMKVKFATQVLSRSVAAALSTHAKVLGVDAIGTAEFVLKFNDLFDIVNSSRLGTSNPNLCAMNDRSPHLSFIHDFKIWLSRMKVMSKQSKVLNANNIKCLAGWQLSLTVIEHLWPVLRDEHNYSFLLTRRLNSDPLENLFSVIRQKGGNCTNPTPFNFQKIFKQVTFEKLFHPIKGGNCEMDLTKILVAISTSSSNNTLSNTDCTISTSYNDSTSSAPALSGLISTNQNTQQGNILDNDKALAAVISSHAIVYPKIPHFCSENEKCIQDNALHYVSGYLLKKLRSWHNCIPCDNIFKGGDGHLKQNEIFTRLKSYTNTSGLENASQAFHLYVGCLEEKLIEIFDAQCYNVNLCREIVTSLYSVAAPTPCSNFPKLKFISFFARFRVYYLLKFYNAEKKPTVPTQFSSATAAEKKYKKLKNS